MLLCIEIYPPESQKNEGLPKPIDSHFVSLNQIHNNNNTSSSVTGNKSGEILWSVGRKAGHYHLSSDKSVSREHCFIKVCTTNTTNKYGGGLRPILEQEQEEEDAKGIRLECERSKDQLCVIVENVGKLGTYIVMESSDGNTFNSSTELQSKFDKNECNKVENAMATGEQSMKSSSEEQTQTNNNGTGGIPVSLSPIALQLILDEKHTTLKPLTGMNEQAILYPLTWIDDQDNDNFQHRVIVQVGKLGSTIVIYRMPTIALIGSGTLAKSEIATHSNQLCRIGAIPTDEIVYVPRMSTFRIPPPSDPTKIIKRQYMELYYNSPVVAVVDLENDNTNKNRKTNDPYCYILVTAQYTASMKQLLAWTCRIPIVAPSFIKAFFDHTTSSIPLPHEHLPKSDNNTFWSYQTIQPNPKLWNGYTMLVIPKPSTTTTNKQQDTDNHDLQQLIRSAGADIVKILQDHNSDTIVHDNTVVIESVQRCINQYPTTILFIAQSHPTNMNPYEKLIQQTFSTSVISFVTTKQIAKCITTQTQLVPERRNKAVVVDDAQLQQQQSSGSTSVKANERTVQNQEDTIQDTDVTMNDNDVITNHHDDVLSEPILDSGTRSGKNSSNVASSFIKSEEKEPVAPSIVKNEVVVLKRTTRTQIPSNGWVRVMPKDKKQRQAMTRSKEEIRTTFGIDDVRDGAMTEQVKGLIVVKGDNNTKNETKDWEDDDTKNRNKQRKTVVDYKTFRKNEITGQLDDEHTTTTRKMIRLRAVLPNEAHNRRDVEEQQQALLEQQRRTDEMFRRPLN